MAHGTGLGNSQYIDDLQMIVLLHDIARDNEDDRLRQIAERFQELVNERLKLLDK